MWWWTVWFFSLVIIHTSALLDSNGTETAPFECCPCPPAETGLAVAPGPVAPGLLAPAPCPGLPGLDRCPCLSHDADSEGSASIFNPNSVLPFGNDVRPKPKEDAKPLLHPEVDLASSMLETLREATDEEYRDALERDAARATTPDMDTVILADVTPVETRNVVTIIVSPENMDSDSGDSMSQASHVHDTRCIHSPLGNARSSVYYQPRLSHKGLDDILNLPLPGGFIHKQRDNNLAASKVHESVVKVDNHLNKFLSGFRFQTGTENINDFTNSHNTDSISSDRRLSEKSNDANQPEKESVSNVFDNQCLNNKDALDVSDTDIDSDPSSSNVQGKYVEGTERQEKNSNAAIWPKFINQNDLWNLNKLRDVELIPLDVRKIVPMSKWSIPDFKLRPFPNNARESNREPIRLPKLFDWLSKPSKISHKGNEVNNGRSINVEDIKESAYVQIIPRNKNVTTEILDVLPSPSEPVNVVSSKDNCLTIQPQEADRVMKRGEELLDSTSAESFESDPETVINFNAKNENDIDISNLDHVNDATETISIEVPEISESNSAENIEIDDIGLDQESNSNIISSQKEISQVSSSPVDFREINDAKERNNTNLAKDHPQKKIDNSKEQIIERFDAVIIQNARDFINRNVKEEPSEGSDTDDEGISLVEQVINSKEYPATESTSITNVIMDELPDVSASIEEVSYKDLQNMSDSLLQESEKNENAEICKEKYVKTNRNLKSSDESKEEKSDPKEMSESELEKELNKARKSTNDGKEEIIEENSNVSSLKKPSNSKSNEMIVPSTINRANCDHDLEQLASDRAISILRPNSKSLTDHLSDFESRLRNVIVQPTPVNKVDLIKNHKPVLDVPDISDLNSNIPTLEEIRTRVSDILGGLGRHSFDEEVSSELDSDDFPSNIHPVLSTGSRTSDSSPLQPLKDINLNIIQLKPLPFVQRVDPLRAEVPGLNLNTFKAKLAIPNSLDIKPLNLASTLSNGGGLVGATLSIGPEQYNNVGNIKSTLSTPEPISLSKLADITLSVQNNTRHFFNQNAFKGHNLRASNNIKDIADNLKHHTKSIINNGLIVPSFDDINTNIKENSLNELISSSRNAIETLKDRAPIGNVVDSLKSQTENTITNTGKDYFRSAQHLNIPLDNHRSQTQNRMNHIQKSLYAPTLTDIGAKVQKHAQDLISFPETVPRRDALEYVLQTAAPIDLKPQAEKAVKDFQKTLKATLKKSQIKSLQHLPPLKNPKEVLQIISNHQEDFNDKLFAIHTDLSDRFESLHNDVIESERLKTILIPPNLRYFESFHIPLPSSRKTMPNAKKPARPVLRTKQPSLGAQRKEFRKSTGSQTSKPKSGTSKLGTMRASAGKERNSPKLPKLESAGTTPTIARIDRPTLPKIYTKPNLSKPLDSQLLKNPLFPQPGLLGAKKPLLPKDNSLTSFDPTSIRPNSAAPIAATKQITQSAKVSNNSRFKPKPFEQQQTPWSTQWGGPKTTALGDSQKSPSIAITKVQAPLISKSVTPINKTVKTAPLLPSLDSLSSRIQPQPLLKTQPELKIQPTQQGRASNPENNFLSRPKKINNSLLGKLSEALKSRQSKPNLSSSPGESSLRHAMAPSASERVDKVVALAEPIKENISYKCKMMCVRTD